MAVVFFAQVVITNDRCTTTLRMAVSLINGVTICYTLGYMSSVAPCLFAEALRNLLMNYVHQLLNVWDKDMCSVLTVSHPQHVVSIE